MGHHITVVAGATTGGSFTGTDPKTFFANADDATVDAAAIAAFLDAGTGVSINTQQSGSQPGDLTVSAAINKTAGGNATLRLTADHDIVVNQQIAGTAGAFGIDLTTNGINAAGGTIAINATLTSNGGFISLSNNSADNGGITFNADVNAGVGTLTLNSLNAPITQTAGTITAGTLTVGLSDAIALNQATNAIANLGAIFAFENISVVDGSGELTITGSVHANTEEVSINTTGDLVTSGSGTVFGATGISLTATGAMTIGAALSTSQPLNTIQLSAGAGVMLNGGNADVSGSLTVNADSNADGVGTFTVNNAGAVVSGDEIDITAADIALAGTLQAPAVALRPSQNAATIGLGGTGSFALSAAELGFISPNASVTIGSAANTGGITIGGTEAASAPNLNLALITGGAISVNATRGLSAIDLVMTADSMALNGGTLAASGTVTLRPLTAGQLIRLGSADAAGILGLTNAELASISSSALLQTIGSSTAGNILISGPITLNNDTVLETAGSIGSSGTIQGNLGMRAGKTINLISSTNDSGTIAADVTEAGEHVFIHRGGHTTIGTVGDVSGITTIDGFFALTAGSVTIDAPINTTSTGYTTITANSAVDGSVGVFADVGNLNIFTIITANQAIVGGGTIHGSSVNLSAADGIGDGAAGVVRTEAGFLSVDNTTTGNVSIVEVDEVTPTLFRNQAPSGTLSLRTLNGSIGAGTVSSNGGQITLTAGDIDAGMVSLGVAGDITSGGGDIRLFSADEVDLSDNVNAGSGNVTIEANSANATESVADNTGEIRGGFDTVSGNTVTLKAATGIGLISSVKTAASTIAVTNTVSGDIVILEADGASFSATNAGSGAIRLTTTSGILTIGAATGTGSGAITLAGAGGINVNAAVTTGSTLALNSSGATAINAALSGLGSLQTDAAGTTTISGGSVTTSGAQTYNDAVTLGAAATLNSTGGPITFAGTVDAAFDLAVNTAGAALFSGAISGAGKLIESGSGTITLAAANLYTGATTLNAGTLLVNGSIVSAATVNSTATLGGTGHTGAVTVASGGTLSPGASVDPFSSGTSAGILSTGDVSVASGATFKVEFGGTTAGSQYDQLNVTGGVTLSGATLDVRFIDFFIPTSGNSFTIISNDGADGVNGTFAGLAEGVTFTVGGRLFSITYHGGSNSNDVVLLAQSPPSPPPPSPPTITSNGGGATASVSVAENSAAVTIVTATDPDPGTTLTYLIAGGSDASKFQINGTNGTLSFNAAPDFELPTDADHNNSYVVQVRAFDGSLFDDQVITVNVTDVNEPSPPPPPPPPVSNNFKVSNDFNGDGNGDILWRHASGQVVEWQMNGAQIAANLNVAAPGTEWKFQDTGDLGGDGISDVIWRHTSGQVVLWKMNGNQIVSNTSILEVSNQYHVQGVADFNGDGKSDVLFRHDSGQVVLWQMDGDRIALNTAISTPSRQFHIEGVGDFGGNGKADVLLRHDNGQVVMWQMDGDRIAVNTAVANVSQEYHVQGVGDFNGDGKSDVVWRHDSGQIVLWQMDGNRIVSNTQILDVSNQYKIQDVRDYNGDGMSDILLRHDSGQVVLWQMNGDKIASNTQVAIVPTDWQIQAHHFDLL